jgi:hypothetical protein
MKPVYHVAPPNWNTLCGLDIKDPEVVAYDTCSLDDGPNWCPECMEVLMKDDLAQRTCHCQEDCDIHNSQRDDNVQCGCGSMLPPELCHYRPDQSKIDSAMKRIDPDSWVSCFEVTIWWDYECHGAAVWGQDTAWYSKEELAVLFKNLHLVCIQVVGGPPLWAAYGAWYQGLHMPQFQGSTNTECQTCLTLHADKREPELEENEDW